MMIARNILAWGPILRLPRNGGAVNQLYIQSTLKNFQYRLIYAHELLANRTCGPRAARGLYRAAAPNPAARPGRGRCRASGRRAGRGSKRTRRDPARTA